MLLPPVPRRGRLKVVCSSGEIFYGIKFFLTSPLRGTGGWLETYIKNRTGFLEDFTPQCKGLLIIILVLLISSCAKNNYIPKLQRTIDIGILSKYSISELLLKGNSLKIITDTGIYENVSWCDITISENGMHLTFNGQNRSLKRFSVKSGEIGLAVKKYAIERIYPDELELIFKNNTIIIINKADLDTYAHAAALNELGALAHAKPAQRKELVSAMEIIIRSYITSQKARHADYRVCDLTHCVAYRGLVENDREPYTKAEVLRDGNRIVESFFHSSCGGVLTVPSVYWNDYKYDHPFKNRNDSINGEILCRHSPHYSWNSRVQLKVIQDLFKTSRIIEIDLTKKHSRTASVILKGHDTKREIGISDFISTIGKSQGWNVVKSNYFDITVQGDEAVFSGKGLGHGIGLCQYGAARLAELGYSYKEILEHYFDAEIITGTE
jgi:stage II sporulation protein D